MLQRIAEREVKKMKMAGYHHLSRELEQYAVSLILKNDLKFLDEITVETINTYQLASNPLRSLKNNVICVVTVLCRAAIDVGVEPEKCYALSDYYINVLEEKADAQGVRDLAIELTRHYAALVQEENVRTFSLPVTRAIRYVYGHLFEPCSVKLIASVLNLHPNYLSRIFKSEVGISLTEYSKIRKLDEAKNLLLNSEHSITEIAEMMGYGSLSYFSKDFRRIYGHSPTHFIATRDKPKEPINTDDKRVPNFPKWAVATDNDIASNL
jgi:AraC-like DNA-binding protein